MVLRRFGTSELSQREPLPAGLPRSPLRRYRRPMLRPDVRSRNVRRRMAARSRCTPIMNASLQTRPRLHVRTDTCDRAVEEERATSANPSVPSSLAQLMLQRFRLVKHLHDLKRPAVVESASDNARFVECGMIY